MSARAGVRLHDALQSYGEHPAFVSGERSLSYSEVREQSLSVARALRDLGVQPGDVVMISLPDSIDAMLTYLACWWVNATPMVIDFRMPMAERAELAKNRRGQADRREKDDEAVALLCGYRMGGRLAFWPRR